MRSAYWFALALAVLFGSALFAAEKYSQCMDNCRPSDRECLKCCDTQREKATQLCRDASDVTQNTCIQTAPAICKKKYPNSEDQQSWCISNVQWWCEADGKARRRDCGVKDWEVPGGCPGELPPQKCEYRCESWNPVSQSCIGPRRNDCERNPQPRQCPYTCQTWHPREGKCIGAPSNACKD